MPITSEGRLKGLDILRSRVENSPAAFVVDDTDLESSNDRVRQAQIQFLHSQSLGSDACVESFLEFEEFDLAAQWLNNEPMGFQPYIVSVDDGSLFSLDENRESDDVELNQSIDSLISQEARSRGLLPTVLEDDEIESLRAPSRGPSVRNLAIQSPSVLSLNMHSPSLPSPPVQSPTSANGENFEKEFMVTRQFVTSTVEKVFASSLPNPLSLSASLESLALPSPPIEKEAPPRPTLRARPSILHKWASKWKAH